MTLKNLIISSIIMGLFATTLIAKEATYVEATKPELSLSKSDLDLVAKAIDKKFKGLTTLERKKLVGFLQDYTKSAKHEISPVEPVKPRPVKTKTKKISRK